MAGNQMEKEVCFDSFFQKETENKLIALGSAVREVAKYPTKLDVDYKNPQVVNTFTKALHKKRQIAYGGLIKTIAQELKLADVDDDLVNVDENEEVSKRARIITSMWHADWNHYRIFKNDRYTDTGDQEDLDKALVKSAHGINPDDSVAKKLAIFKK